ncbi:addiction module toxin RelE [Candidatus Pacearchaeota archaeon]|nr:addiction module toxin RelE [Candidatus Pacearchaeota archaeon]
MRIDTTSIQDTLKKLKRKDSVLFRAVQKKINQISQLDIISINHLKNLRGNLSKYKRVHVGNFVLMFKVEKNIIIFDKFEHHDKAY